LKLLVAVVVLAAFAQGQNPNPIAGRIRIERTLGGDQFGPAEIVVWAGDLIHWSNETGEVHEPGVLRRDGAFVAFLERPVAPGTTSAVFSPLARVDASDNQVGFTIHYVCGRHRNEKGVIQVVPTP
jgi:plastocyanin